MSQRTKLFVRRKESGRLSPVVADGTAVPIGVLLGTTSDQAPHILGLFLELSLLAWTMAHFYYYSRFSSYYASFKKS